MPKSLRKYIRREKARIRREVSDMREQDRLISELYTRFFRQNEKDNQNQKVSEREKVQQNQKTGEKKRKADQHQKANKKEKSKLANEEKKT